MVKYGKLLEEEFIRDLHYSQKRIIGAEVELQAVQANGRAVTWQQVSNFFKDLVSIGWEPVRDGKRGLVVGVKNSKTKHSVSDYILTDTGYCLIELSMAPEYNLHKVRERYIKLVKIATKIAEKNDFKLLSYGIQPVTKPSFKLLSPRKRYIFFRRVAKNPQFRAATTIISSNQANVNMKNPQETIASLNTLLMLVPLQLALFANSPVWAGRLHPRFKVIRPVFWYGAYEPWRTGMPMRPFRDLEDYFRYIWGLEAFLVVRDGKYYEIEGKPPFTFYLKYGGYGHAVGSKTRIKLIPLSDDIIYHNGFVWWESRIKTPYNSVYIENRTCCTQPPGEQMTVFAFNLGVVENLEGVAKASKGLMWQDFLDARYSAMMHTLKGKIGNVPIYEFASKVLKAAEIGLKKRGLGEEKYFKPLWERIRTKESPADRITKIYKKEGIKGLIEYSKLTLKKESLDD